MGSGTTGIAALNCNRNFIGIEKDSKYFEVSSARIIEAAVDKHQVIIL
jgi:site-specific DNA-methyltransferase (adenine-specific)